MARHMGHKRGRKWYPKFKCACVVCGWKSIRTEFKVSSRCPRCSTWSSVKRIAETNEATLKIVALQAYAEQISLGSEAREILEKDIRILNVGVPMADQLQNKLKQVQALRKIGSGGAPVKAKCGLCGAQTARYRYVRKSHRELSTG